MTCSNGTTPFLIQFALELDYYLKQKTMENGVNADDSVWLVDTLASALDYYAESELKSATKQSDLNSPCNQFSYSGGNYEQVMELKNLLCRSYHKSNVQRTYDYFHHKSEESYFKESPLDDRSDAVLMTEVPDSWYE